LAALLHRLFVRVVKKYVAAQTGHAGLAAIGEETGIAPGSGDDRIVTAAVTSAAAAAATVNCQIMVKQTVPAVRVAIGRETGRAPGADDTIV
jgi:hypothetical protein